MRRSNKFLTMILSVIMLLGLMPANVFAHYDDAYWHEQQQSGDNKAWMSKIKDNTKLSELSIPGTHDSMAYKSNLSFIDNTRTQTMSLSQQLNSGIRYIDIRAKYTNSGFPLHHGIIYLGFDFEDVLRELRTFLSQNPTETVIMKFSQENSSASDNDMRRVFLTYYNRYKDIFYRGSNDTNPTLGECRGKIVLLSNVLSLNDLGLNYRKVNVQDDYHLNTNWDLYSKWTKIKNFANSITSDKLNLNHLSGNGGAMPYFVASGHSNPATGAARLATGLTEPGFHSYYPDFPRVNWFGVFATIAFEGTNTLYANYIRDNIPYTGIVAADFPGNRLISGIISKNDGLRSDIYHGRFVIKLKNQNAVIDKNNIDNRFVTFWNRNNGINQQWDIRYDESKKAYRILSAEDNSKVLTFSDGEPLDYLQLTTNTGSQNQYWVISTTNGGVTLKSLSDTSKSISAIKGFGDGQSIYVDKNANLSQQTFELIKIN